MVIACHLHCRIISPGSKYVIDACGPETDILAVCMII